MKVQIEISDKVLLKVSTIALVAAKNEEDILKIREAYRNCKGSEEPFIVSLSVFNEEAENIQLALASAVMAELVD